MVDGRAAKPDVSDDEAAARDGYVAGTLFARRYPAQDPRVLLRVLLTWPLPQAACDFFDGFLAGAETELSEREHGHPFMVEWTGDADIVWGETEWVLAPQPGDGPWRPRRE